MFNFFKKKNEYGVDPNLSIPEQWKLIKEKGNQELMNRFLECTDLGEIYPASIITPGFEKELEYASYKSLSVSNFYNIYPSCTLNPEYIQKIREIKQRRIENWDLYQIPTFKYLLKLMIDTGKNTCIPDTYMVNIFHVSRIGTNKRIKQFKLRNFLNGNYGFRFASWSSGYIVRLVLQNFAEKQLFYTLNLYINDLGTELGMEIINKLGEYAKYLYTNNIELQDCEAGILNYPYNIIMKNRESNPDSKDYSVIDAKNDRKIRKNKYNGEWCNAKPINENYGKDFYELKDYIANLVMQNISDECHRIGLDESVLKELNKMNGYVPLTKVFELLDDQFKKNHPYYYDKDGKMHNFL